jgi:hypothetical protein
MQPAASDHAAVRKAVALITEKQAAMLGDIEGELGSLLGTDTHKRTLVMASAVWLTTINAFAIAYDNEEDFISFMQELLHDRDGLRGHYRNAQARRAELHPA